MKKLRIHWLNTGEIDTPLSLSLFHEGINPKFTSEEMKPYRYNPETGMTPCPVPVWYIEGTDKKILVDTGLSDRSPDEAKELVPKYHDDTVWVKRPEHDIVKQLDRLGVRPEDIDIVLMTHCHCDHIANTEIFTNATFVMQREELSMALRPPAFGFFYFPEWSHHLLNVMDRIEAISGDRKIADGVEVWKVGGHSPGSQVIVVETALGKVILSGDLCYNYKNLEYEWPAGVAWSLEQWEKSLNMIKKNADIVVPNHDYYLLELFPSGVIG